MPKTKFQDFVYTIMMVVIMVYAMLCYNLVLNQGASNRIFLEALRNLPLTAAISFVVEFFFVGKAARKIAFKIVDPKTDKPIFVVLAISTITVVFMCPIMSFISGLLRSYEGIDRILINWLVLTVRNFPMALCWQLFYAGPLVRFLFNKIFKSRQ